MAPENDNAVGGEELRLIGDGEIRTGVTVSVLSHVGMVHVVLNAVDDPFEVFVSVSKGGNDVDAGAAAVARLVSIILRIRSEIPSRRRLELVIEQLRGIATQQGYGANVGARSVPDAIAIALATLSERVE